MRRSAGCSRSLRWDRHLSTSDIGWLTGVRGSLRLTVLPVRTHGRLHPNPTLGTVDIRCTSRTTPVDPSGIDRYQLYDDVVIGDEEAVVATSALLMPSIR